MIMLGFIKRLFPIRAKSLDDFAEIIKREQCRVVEGEGFRSPVGFHARTVAVGKVGHFQYSVELTSETSGGRKIIFREVCEKKFGSDYGFPDAPDRNRAAIKIMLTAEDILNRLREKLFSYSVETYVKGPPGRLDKALLRKLHQDAEKLGVKP